MRFLHISDRKPFRIRERTAFLNRLAKLMKEGYLFPAALHLLLPVHAGKPEEAAAGVHSVLSGGGTAAETLQLLGFRKDVLFAAEIAEYHGRLAESLALIAAGFDRTEKLRKKFTSVLLYPVSLLLFTFVLFSLFRTRYIPELHKLIATVGSEESASAVPVQLLKLPDLFLGLLLLVVVSAVSLVTWQKKRPAEDRANTWLKIPVAGHILRMYWSHLFSRELGTLLHSGISLQEALTFLKNQEHDQMIQLIADTIHSEVMTGQPLSVAVSFHRYFPHDFQSFITHGEAAGHLGKELLLYSEVLLERLERQLAQAMRIIQPLFFLVIALCIIGAYLAILLPMYNLVHTI
ncbi:competence type IV pilus assembly protein ComGB [Planococcus lenghuensis]|uniref:Competence protein ComG n=1 Tax=Planococcus lenghuensis TaxID=2213202 RepID=A0A1Q2KY07_9BACL|nr:competence type IV pilus assembly protein ComGB [Planococcus lenghuensis]AQQ53006.1 competence protein ComG [Planococcus lenghuensis]